LKSELPTATAARFARPAIADPQELIFGRAVRPVRCGLGLAIGAGEVYPELNFTLPPMTIDAQSWPKVRQVYDRLAEAILARARDLHLNGLVIEFEHLPPMTECPEWGAELTALLKDHLRRAADDFGLAAALRVTIVDLREHDKPPRRRGGSAWRRMLASLEACAQAGADILSIESTGGKEIHDTALTRADVPAIVFALGVLAPRDMQWLWSHIVELAARYEVVPGGDTACGFANTAMQLAHQHMLPDVLAALVRAFSAPRTLVAHECGAVGPSKDCAYENPVIKAITGCPISMEGRSAACAHFSPLGNIAAAMADLWSNESVPDVRLLSGPAPLASLEALVYDCRLFNTASARGQARTLCDLHVLSDAATSAQAYLMTPDATVALARAITAEPDRYRRTLAAGRCALQLLAAGLARGELHLAARERRWLDRLRRDFDALPDSEELLRSQMEQRYRGAYDPREYGMGA